MYSYFIRYTVLHLPITAAPTELHEQKNYYPVCRVLISLLQSFVCLMYMVLTVNSLRGGGEGE